MTDINSIRRGVRIGSGTVIVGTIIVVFSALLYFGTWVGWIETWSTFAIPSIQPPFRDMHAITDHAACAAKGFNAYLLNSCDPLRTVFNYPPVWLWLGYLGISGDAATWLSVPIAIAALGVFVALTRGRSMYAGAVASIAVISPSMMLGIERGNVDLLIFALVGGAALTISGWRSTRLAWALAPLVLAVVLKLYPLFCVTLAARRSWRSFIVSAGLAVVSLAYIASIYDYISLIKENTPSTYFVSYGYKVAFLGFDRLLIDAGRFPTGLAATWVPITAAILTLMLAALVALRAYARGSSDCTVTQTAAGAAFLCGAGIYCGTFMLGTNYSYRLMFLLLCLPQLFDWMTAVPGAQRTPAIACFFLAAILLALWLNAIPFFMLVPQLAGWALLFGFAAVLLLNVLNSAKTYATH